MTELHLREGRFSLGPRRPFVVVCVIVFAVTGVEIAALHFLAGAFIHAPTWRAVVEWSVNIATVVFMAAFMSGASGRVDVAGDSVVVRFGLMGAAAFPRADVASAALRGPSLETRGWIGCQLLQDGRAYFSLSGDGDFVELRLSRPAQVRYLFWKRGETSTVIVSADGPEWT